MCCLPKDAAFFIKPLNFCNFGPRPCLYPCQNPLNFRFGFDVIDSNLGTSDAFMSKLQMMNECNGVHY